MKKFIQSVFKKSGIDLDESKLFTIIEYMNLLKEYNSKFNITAIKEDEEIVIKHFLDSAYISKAIDLTPLKTLLDIGTGGGFPGLPLKILYPHLSVTLIDSTSKKINFVNTVIKTLELTNISSICIRSEVLAHDPLFRESFDVVTSRAVAYMPILSEYALPFVKPCGKFLAMKNEDCKKEVDLSANSIRILGGNVNNIYKYELPDIPDKRSIVIIDKVKLSPEIYPRTNAQIKKRSL